MRLLLLLFFAWIAFLYLRHVWIIVRRFRNKNKPMTPDDSKSNRPADRPKKPLYGEYVQYEDVKE